MAQQKEIKEFSIKERTRSFGHALRGLRIFFRTAHNAWIHASILLVTILLGLYLHLSHFEWLFLVLAAGLVLSAEAFNSAIEIDIDLTSPDYHPYARDTKDVAAAAVLITACTAFIIGLCIFIPHIQPLL